MNIIVPKKQPLSSAVQMGRWEAGMLAGLFVVYKFFGLASTAVPGDLMERGRRHCAQRWDALQLSRGTEFHLDYYCFR